MKPFRHIIAAIDFTPSCRNALREASRLASLDGAALTVVHVMDEFLVHELKRALAADQITIRHDWTRKLQEFVSESDVGAVHAEAIVRIGHPLIELSDVCRTEGVDLLVMGSRGSKNEPNRVGAIAAKCVRKAPVDVLLVREDAQGPFKHLVTCVDFSENSAKAVRHALKIAEQDGAVLDCLHVYQSALAMSLDYGGMVAPMPIGADPEALDMWRRELNTFLAPILAGSTATVTQHIVERVNIRESILEHVREHRADLVVLGTRGKTGLREILIGTTAEKIIANAPCSILAIKPDGFIGAPD